MIASLSVSMSPLTYKVVRLDADEKQCGSPACVQPSGQLSLQGPSVSVSGLTPDSGLATVPVTIRLALNTFYEWTEGRSAKIAAG